MKCSLLSFSLRLSWRDRWRRIRTESLLLPLFSFKEKKDYIRGYLHFSTHMLFKLLCQNIIIVVRCLRKFLCESIVSSNQELISLFKKEATLPGFILIYLGRLKNLHYIKNILENLSVQTGLKTA